MRKGWGIKRDGKHGSSLIKSSYNCDSNVKKKKLFYYVVVKKMLCSSSKMAMTDFKNIEGP